MRRRLLGVLGKALTAAVLAGCASVPGHSSVQVLRRRPGGFVVTPKTRQARQPFPWRLIWPQLLAMGVLVVACVVGGLRLWLGTSTSVVGTGVNWLWVAYDLLVLSVIIEAARFRAPEFPSDIEEIAA